MQPFAFFLFSKHKILDINTNNTCKLFLEIIKKAVDIFRIFMVQEIGPRVSQMLSELSFTELYSQLKR